MATFPTSAGSFGNSFGSFGGDLLSNAVGVGSNIGGTLGGLAGGAFFGPLGALGGSFLGNSVGKLFGFGAKEPKTPRASYYYDFTTDTPTTLRSKTFDGEGVDALSNVAKYIGLTSESMLNTLGLKPTTQGFSMGTYGGRAGYLLPDDPWVKPFNPNTKWHDGWDSKNLSQFVPSAYQFIDPDYYNPALQGVRAFGNRDEALVAPDSSSLGQMSQSAIDAIVSNSIKQAGLTNRQVFEKAGLPTELEALKGALPGLAFGDNFGLDNPFQFKPSELMSLYQQGGMTGGMTGAPTAGIGAASSTGNAGRLQSIYAQYQQRMPQGTVRQQPSYYSRWGG